jgi:hypothetical protein
VEYPVFSILVLVAFGLLLTVSGGIAYLTLAEWRDRRRREKESREQRLNNRSGSKVRK